MDENSRKKVIAAGFTIIRADDVPVLRIKYKGKATTDWRTLEKDFPSKAARDRRFNELRKESNIITD